MSHVQVLREVESRGLSLSAAGADLRLEGPRDRMDADLIGRIRAHKAELIAHLAGTASGGFPLTPLQRGYLLGRGDGFEIGNVANHVYRELEGVWDVDRLEAALRAVVARHGMLRTRFTADGRQIEQRTAEVHIGRLDLRGRSTEEQERRRTELRAQRSHRMLPLDTAPLFAVEVTILADDRMVLHISQDGLVADGISALLLLRDWWTVYRDGPAEYPADDGLFEAYVAALESARGKAPALRSRQYWFDRLDTLAPAPELPLRTDPSSISHPRFVPRTVRLNEPVWAALKARAGQAGVTPSAALLTAYAETLSAWGAGDRFTVTTTVANRLPFDPRVAEAVGAFSDTMLVEVALDRTVGFAERARAVQAQLRRDLDHRHFSGVEVLRELGRRNGTGVVRMPFTFNSAIGALPGGVDGSALDLFGTEVYSVSQTPQVWLNVFATERQGGLVLQIDGVDELFPDGLLDALVDGYRRLLHRLADEPAWSATVFDLLPDDQHARRRYANDTVAPVPDGQLTDGFVAAATSTPDAPAVITSSATMSYGELYDRVRHAAAWLRGHGVGRDELVGLVMTRGPEQVVGILATLLAGAAYLPVDATLPAWRQRYLLRDGRVRTVLTNAGWTGDVPALDLARPPTQPAPDTAEPDWSEDDLAYVLYTSGTTGEPKGVMVRRCSVANVVADCNARFGIGARDRFLAVSAFTFDLSVYDVLGALSAGAALVLPDPGDGADPAHWLRLCGRAGVTVLNAVPAIVAMLHDQAVVDGAESLAALRLVLMSGDRIPPTLPAALWRLKPDLTLVSLGGPTETTVWNVVHPIGRDEDGSRAIPYGRPNANNRAYVVDAAGRDAPDWVSGEICAAGIGLARGYRDDAARTAERFVDDPVRGERLYRTGDLGRYLPDGNIEILGRNDHQIKVNGYRIEAGEVETRLLAVDGVRAAAVVRQEAANGARLVAHLVPAGAARPSHAELYQALRAHLPEYMIPSAVVWHERLPLTGNGKVDRSRLSTVDAAATGVPPTAGSGPATPTEEELAALWASTLRVDTVTADASFGDLGGDSIAAARIVAAVRKRFGVAIPLHRLPELATVRAMAAHVDAAGTGEGAR